jgi:hypothetical protein
MKYILFLSAILFFACGNSNDPQLIPTTHNFDLYLINTGGCVYKDSLTLDSLGSDLFADKNGNIYFKGWDVVNSGPSLPVMILRIYNGCEGGSEFDLKNNIDTGSFHFLGTCYYADSRRIIVHHEGLNGGSLGIIEKADVKTFRVIPWSKYGSDKYHVYYDGLIVTEADPKTFRGIYKYTGHDTSCFFGQDDKNYFDGKVTCSKDKVESRLKE